MENLILIAVFMAAGYVIATTQNYSKKTIMCFVFASRAKTAICTCLLITLQHVAHAPVVDEITQSFYINIPFFLTTFFLDCDESGSIFI